MVFYERPGLVKEFNIADIEMPKMELYKKYGHLIYCPDFTDDKFLALKDNAKFEGFINKGNAENAKLAVRSLENREKAKKAAA